MFIPMNEELFWNIIETAKEAAQEREGDKSFITNLQAQIGMLREPMRAQFMEQLEEHCDRLHTEKIAADYRKQAQQSEMLFESFLTGIVAKGRDYYLHCLTEGQDVNIKR